MKDERFKNAGTEVWVWDAHKKEARKRILLAENKSGGCMCVCGGDEEESVFDVAFYLHYSFTDPNKVEYEPYGAGEMPQLDWFVVKENGVKLLVTGYDPNGNEQLCVNGFWKSNKDVFNHYTDINGNPIGKEKR